MHFRGHGSKKLKPRRRNPVAKFMPRVNNGDGAHEERSKEQTFVPKRTRDYLDEYLEEKDDLQGD